MVDKVKIGIVGCGNISGIYFKAGKTFENLEIVACADLIMDRARAKAEEFGIPKACSVEELLADPEIQIVVNLTIPKAHAEVTMAALNAGKNAYAEKPMAISLEDGQKILELAKAKGLRVGGAPDTFLGGGIQTCRKLIDDGWIGEPIGATAFMLCHGHESWHPDPEFYYEVGGGPMFDMGPYYLTALVTLMGPVKRVTGSTRITFPERTITSAPKYGKKIQVEVPTHVAGIMEFESGAIGTILTSFDVWHSQLPRIEIYGSEGTLMVPDPNTFGGPVYIRRKDQAEWKEIPLTHGYAENSRGIGVSDMAYALVSGRPHRASGELTYHVLEIMHGFHIAAEEGRHYELKSTCERPAPLPLGLMHGTLDR
ncbi:Predicted dehydrogenase [Caldanaerobius fijiensis DSM 17918]|uniref:Predicted dehydrogenase n=1 Tax=Caldanaerobius fijiensis DSM 17918 TaxID=1121256 RepID=A0A1M5D5E1_9THEO|nr:Gfo/Idh/MocA family oxidoreductase [Caldanaerobius fijiensis]SHF62191.1 Predicted dehydrogenase [Caldanaerobius fijiensis DSM 17918]